MELTPSTLTPFFQNLRLDYQAGYANAPTQYQSVSSTIPSNTEQNVYGWMDFIGAKMRQWIGERYVRNLVARGTTATNLLFELTTEVPRAKIEDDQYALYGQKMAMMGRQAAIWPDDQVFTLLANGGSATLAPGYDGVALFSNAHPKDPSGEISGTQSNDLGLALTGANFATGLATGKAYVGRDGAPMGTFSGGKPLLVVGPTLEKTARDLVSANFFSPAANYGAAAANAPSENTYMGAADMLVSPWITSSTAWFLIDRSFGIMPLIWQLRQAPQLSQRTADTDPNVFERDVFQYGIRARGVATPGLWFLIIRGNS